MKNSSRKSVIGTFLCFLFISCNSHAQGWPHEVTDELCVVNGASEARSQLEIKRPSSEEIMQLERNACWMLAKREMEKLRSDILHEHGLLFIDGGPLLYGAEQQIAMFKEFLEENDVYLTFEPVEAHVSESEDMAWAFGIYKFRLPQQPMEVGKYVSVWEKVDGEWRNVVEMRNPF